MKFEKHVDAQNNIITRKFTCEVCGYVYSVKYQNKQQTVVIGDNPVEIYPAFSLRKQDGTHNEVCSCPACSVMQVLNYE